MKNQVGWARPECVQWANRLLIASLVGICYLTLFPFHFDFALRHFPHASPLLLGESLKQGSYLDFFLNILLFIPFGFAISSQLQKRSVGRVRALIFALVAGAITSYVVELLQYYIPTRSSAWDDIGPNSTGALAGFLIFDFCGAALLRKLSKWEDTLQEWMSSRRTIVLMLVYFGLCFGVSIPLQLQTRLSNWDPRCGLFVGNDASSENAWKGHVTRLQIWNRAIPEGLVQRMSTGGQGPDAQSGLLVSYDFTTPPPYLDQMKFLSALAWVSAKPPSEDRVQGIEIDRTSWLATTSPVGKLTGKIEGTNQFTVRVICAPAGIHGTDGRIISISQSAENVNLHLRQEGTTLVLWFRNPLSQSRSLLAWYVPGVFKSGQRRDIVASYDGSDASVYLDGKKMRESYRLSPGASLAHSLMAVRTANLGGYVVVYETLIFLPAGLMIGIPLRKWSKWKSSIRLLLAVELLLAPVFLELVLIWVSGREILPGNIFFSLLLTIAGIWLINADRSARQALLSSRDSIQAG
jgi:glycopeptide antibiotics resistance protein/NADH:ubiquinone oxidoreductase subunit K